MRTSRTAVTLPNTWLAGSVFISQNEFLNILYLLGSLCVVFVCDCFCAVCSDLGYVNASFCTNLNLRDN